MPLDWLRRQAGDPEGQVLLAQGSVALDNLRICEKEVEDVYAKVKLEIDTEQQARRYRIDDTRRALKVTRARISYDGTLLAERDGRLLDLQVVRGQTVKPSQRLGTLGSLSGQPGERMALAQFSMSPDSITNAGRTLLA